MKSFKYDFILLNLKTFLGKASLEKDLNFA